MPINLNLFLKLNYYINSLIIQTSSDFDSNLIICTKYNPHTINNQAFQCMQYFTNQKILCTFSTHLRFFQLGIQTLISLLICKIDNKGCSTSLTSVAQPICIMLVPLNLAALAVLKFTKAFNKKAFIGLFVLNLILSAVLVLVGFLGIGQANSCANNRILLRMIGFQAMVAIAMSGVTIYANKNFALQFTNAPGNFAWVFLFFAFDWSKHYKFIFTCVGVIFLVMTLCNLCNHQINEFWNCYSNRGRITFLLWTGSLLAMAVAQIMVFCVYITGGNDRNSITDVAAKKLAQIFLFVNLADASFWIYGFFGLKINSERTQSEEEAFGISEIDTRNDCC